MMNYRGRTWAGLAFGGVFAALGISAVLSAGVLAQTSPTQTPPPLATPGATAMPNLNPASLPPGDSARGEALAGSASCTGCHGEMGVSISPEFPRLAGQRPSYMTAQLLLLRAGIRKSQIMNRVAANLSDADISDLVAYFTSQKVGDAWAGQDAALRAEGAKLYAGGAPERSVIACTVCHGMAGLGMNDLGIAVIRHQSPEYAVSVMNEFKALGTGGTPLSTAMYLEMKPLTDREYSALAAYLASMP